MCASQFLDLLSSLGNKLYLSINPEVLNKKGEGGSRARLKELGDRRCHECFQKVGIGDVIIRCIHVKGTLVFHVGCFKRRKHHAKSNKKQE
jgi:hypothetical protein